MYEEEQTIRSFVVRRKRERYLEFLRKPATRKKFTNMLAHFADVEDHCRREIPPSKHSPMDIKRILDAKGAPELCHIVSEHPDFDGKEMPLLDALEAFVGRGMGAILSCIPGQLAFMETEDERFILQKDKKPLRPTPCIRFKARLIDPDSKYEEGIFMSAHRLRDEGDLTEYQSQELRSLLHWFNENLHAPDALEHDYNKSAISWFKSRAKPCVSRIWTLVHILEEHGVVIDKITTEDPGYVIYEDKWQVVAHPSERTFK